MGSTNGDYINANYVNMEIPGSGIINRYIATQGPLSSTVADFWQMVLEAGSTLVVMLTTLVERGRAKCHQYWPALNETLTLRNLTLTSTAENVEDTFIFREFILRDINVREASPGFLIQWGVVAPRRISSRVGCFRLGRNETLRICNTAAGRITVFLATGGSLRLLLRG